MPIEPIKIPQNVYIEDRIVGPLTLKQILIVALGNGISYAMYAMLAKNQGGVSVPVIALLWIPGAISVIFAFVKINDLSMFRLCLLLFERINKPVLRTWAPRRGIIINIRTFSTVDDKHVHKAVEKLAEKRPQRIDELSAALDDLPQIPADDEPLSPADEQLPAEEPAVRPVDRSRITASVVQAPAVDTVAPPKSGSVSLFRDLSPKR